MIYCFFSEQPIGAGWRTVKCVWHNSQYLDPEVFFMSHMSHSRVKKRIIVICSGLECFRIHAVDCFHIGLRVIKVSNSCFIASDTPRSRLIWDGICLLGYQRLLSYHKGQRPNCTSWSYRYKAPVAVWGLNCKAGILLIMEDLWASVKWGRAE